MRNFIVSTAVLLIAIASFASAQAQRPARGGGNQQGPPRMPPPGELDEEQALLFRAGQNANANQASAQDATTQNMPSIEQLATMMLANFDVDESGGLDQTELQNALVALRQMMQTQNVDAATTNTAAQARQSRVPGNAFRARGR